MSWIYWAKLYNSRFQADCLKARIQEDWWVNDYESPVVVEVFRSVKGKYGVRFAWEDLFEKNSCI